MNEISIEIVNKLIGQGRLKNFSKLIDKSHYSLACIIIPADKIKVILIGDKKYYNLHTLEKLQLNILIFWFDIFKSLNSPQTFSKVTL